MNHTWTKGQNLGYSFEAVSSQFQYQLLRLERWVNLYTDISQGVADCPGVSQAVIQAVVRMPVNPAAQTMHMACRVEFGRGTGMANGDSVNSGIELPLVDDTDTR